MAPGHHRCPSSESDLESAHVRDTWGGRTGGEISMNPIGDFEFREMHEIIKLSESQVSLIGNDICVKSSLKN